MFTSIKIAPPNSIIFISDKSGGKIPELTRERRIWWTPSCIVVGCLAFMDGKTDVSLGDLRDVNSMSPPVFEGNLETPSLSVVVSTVEDKNLLSVAVSNKKSHVKIWANHPVEPDKIMIGLE